MSSIAVSNSDQSGVFYEHRAPRRAKMSQALVFSGWLAVTVIGAILTPDSSLHGTHQQLGLPPCPSVMLFDRPCPGCGLTTSWTALIHGNLPMALHAHVFGPMLYFAYTMVALMSLVGLVRGWRLRTEARWFQAVSTVVLALVVSYGAIRFATTPHYATSWERSILAASK